MKSFKNKLMTYLALLGICISLSQNIQAQTQVNVSIRNAGIVLVNDFISRYFERLGLINEKKQFTSPEAQILAARYIWTLSTGKITANEPDFAMSKLLTGLPLDTPIASSPAPTPEGIEIGNGLIQAMISHWPANGASSLDGFRGAWLIRDGFLVEKNDHWELSVERRSYDVLIRKAPYSFSVIRYPWMSKAVYVNWPY